MKIIRLSDGNQGEILSVVGRLLRSGKIIICPTDTVYGILGDAMNKEAILKIFEIKNRSLRKPLPVFVRDIRTARRLAYISDAKAEFLKKNWPGAVTAVFQRKEKFPAILTGGLETIGMRMPNHEFLLKLLKRLDFPLAQTSANISGMPPAKNSKEINSYFGKSEIGLDLIIDGGEFFGSPSTIVDFTGKEPLILRVG